MSTWGLVLNLFLLINSGLIFIFTLFIFNALYIFKKQTKQNIYLNTSYYVISDYVKKFFIFIAYAIGPVGIGILLYFLIDGSGIKKIENSEYEVNHELKNFFLYSIITLSTLSTLIYVFQFFQFLSLKKDFKQNKNKIFHLSYENIMEFDLSNYSYDFNEVTYKTIFNKEKKLSKVINFFKIIDFFRSFSNRNFAVFLDLCKIPNLEINFRFSNERDKVLWLYKNILTKLTEKNTFKEEDIQSAFEKAKTKYSEIN
ncbi:hypothetical protein ACW95P_03620 [Candidatus Mycoplasma pogonae]